MVKTFDFLFRAWADKAFVSKIYEYLHSNKSGELSTDILRLCFDGATKEVFVSSSKTAGFYGPKITPVCITYNGIEKLINKHFDDLKLGEILYMPLD